MDQVRLSEATVVVTGGAHGIGQATARMLARRAGRVVVVDVDPVVSDVAADLGDAAVGLCADLTVEDEIERLVREVVDRTGRIDALVNNAGVGRHNPVPEMRTADLDLMWALNVRAPMLLSREAWPELVARRGQIVNVVSTAGLRGGPGEAAYCATKFALRGFSQGLAEEGRAVGVRVHAVLPAGVDTGFWRDATAAGPGVDPGAAFLTADDVAAAIVAALESPPHLHQPEVVLQALADADLGAIRAKLEWFRQ